MFNKSVMLAPIGVNMAEEAVVVTKKTFSYNPFRAAPLISTIILVWVLILHASPVFYHTFPTPLGLFHWRIIATIVLLIMLVSEAKKFSSGGDAPQDDSASEEKGKGKKKHVEYPPKISGVIYADTYVSLGAETDVKIRTMLARACPLCDKEEECWENVGSRISKDDFLSNMECKEGLREMGAL